MFEPIKAADPFNPMWITAIAAVVFGLLTSVFAYKAHRTSLERFRLDLFERRWQVFLDIRRAALAARRVPDTVADIHAMRDGEYSELRNEINARTTGAGRNEVVALFGETVASRMTVIDDLAQARARLARSERLPDRAEEAEAGFEAAEKAHNAFINGLDELFAPYLSFARHKAQTESFTTRAYRWVHSKKKAPPDDPS